MQKMMIVGRTAILAGALPVPIILFFPDTLPPHSVLCELLCDYKQTIAFQNAYKDNEITGKALAWYFYHILPVLSLFAAFFALVTSRDYLPDEPYLNTRAPFRAFWRINFGSMPGTTPSFWKNNLMSYNIGLLVFIASFYSPPYSGDYWRIRAMESLLSQLIFVPGVSFLIVILVSFFFISWWSFIYDIFANKTDS